MNILQITGLSVSFDGQPAGAMAVDGVGFDVARGEVFGLVGESGSGKTMTALSILRLVPYPGRIVSGRVVFGGMDLLAVSEDDIRKVRGAKISMVFQEPGTSFDPVFTIGSQLIEALTAHSPARGRNPHPGRPSGRDLDFAGLQCPRGNKELRDVVLENLLRVHIKDPERVFACYPHQLSGGMKQRVMIAMALANSPELIILDEPTTALDVTIQAGILDLLEEIKEKEKLSMLFISHDLGIIARMADRVAVMKAGRIVESGVKSDILHSPRQEYTISLLGSVKRLSCA